ncbi:MAG: flagellar biosynthetic protein FliP, partial [Lachnospiraceae bacterium]
MRKYIRKAAILLFMILVMFMVSGTVSYATTDEGDVTAGEDDAAGEGDEGENLDDDTLFGIDISTSGETGGIASALQIVIILTIIALCPSILIMLTSFTRILVVMHFTRSALNTQSAPPNQILIGISLFLTFFVMAPVFEQIY